MRIKRKITPLILSLGICFIMSGCHSNEFQETLTITTEETTQNSVNESETVFADAVTFDTGSEAEVTESVENIQSRESAYPIIITPTLTSNIDFAIESEDIFCIFNGEKFGYITKSGDEITDYIYDAAYPFSEGLACVMADGKYGFIDTAGKEILPLIYDDAAPFQDGLAYFALDDTYGFMTKDGTVAFYLDCDSVSSFQEGLAYFCIDGMYGYMDKTGQTVIEASYSDADYFKNGIAFITIDGNKGAIDTNGNVVIPIEYEKIQRWRNYITASVGEESKYYDMNGKEISKEEYEEKTNQHINITQSENFTVKEEDNLFTILNAEGDEVFSNECSFTMHDIYGDYKNYILKQSFNPEKSEQIVILEENDDIDLSDILLKNSITPRKKLFWNLTHGIAAEVTNTAGEVSTIQKFNLWCNDSYIKKAKFYNADYSGNPILYCYEEPCLTYNFPLSDSGFYSLTDGKLKQLVSGYECGGSMRGDYVCLWKDSENGRTMIGTSGAVGGFGGYSTYSTIYSYNAGNTEEVLSYTWIGNVGTWYFEEEDLLENAHLFYDAYDLPLTPDTILEEESLNEYTVNEIRVPIEEYREATQKYRMFDLF